jgi:histidinol-phosphate aminotransferase
VVDQAHIADEVKKNAAARAYTRKVLEGAGFVVHSTDANFLMTDIHRDAKAFKLELVKQKVVIGRQFPGLPTHARISIGTMAEMKKAMPIVQKVLASTAAASQH